MPDRDRELRALLALRLAHVATDRNLVRRRDRIGSYRELAEATVEGSGWRAADAELRRADALGVQLIMIDDPEYPTPLQQSSDPPPLLYVRGELSPGDDPAIAIVGARRASPEGRRIAYALAGGLTALGLTVISGLARGIDGAAHRAVVDDDGRTLAVLGCGVDVVYPAQHRELARRITRRGALVSEFPLGTRPQKHHFPIRNRVIATLARVVVVVQAAEKSGSLITARLAVEEGRSVLAVPCSPMSDAHRGSNALLRDGARPALSLEDVVDELPYHLRPAPLRSPDTADGAVAVQVGPALTDTERRVLEAMSYSAAMSIDQVAEEARVSARETVASLLSLELGGRVEKVAGGRYQRLGAVAEFTGAPCDRNERPVLSSELAPPSKRGKEPRNGA